MAAKKKVVKKSFKKEKSKSTRAASVRALLNRVEYEGMHYAFVDYGMEEYLKQVDDKVLNKLAADFIKSSNSLQDHLDALDAEFPDESDLDIDEIEFE